MTENEAQESVNSKTAGQVLGDVIIGIGGGIFIADLLPKALSVDISTKPGVLAFVGVGVAALGAEVRALSDSSPVVRRVARMALSASIAVGSYIGAYQSYEPGPSWGEEGFDTQDGPEGSPVGSVLVIGSALGAVAVWPRGGNSEQEENTDTSSGKPTV